MSFSRDGAATRAIRVLIADDHGVIRAGLSQLLDDAEDIDVIAKAGGGHDAVRLCQAVRPDVILMDLSMPDLDGIAATRAIMATVPESRIVILTSFCGREQTLEALDAGAIGFMLKDAEPEALLRGVRAAARGESPLAPRAARHVITRQRTSKPAASLTVREQEVLGLVAQGLPNKVIARRLSITENTVKNHATHIFQAL